MENMKIQEPRYTQVFVENGKKGVKDNEGNVLIPAMFDEIGTLWVEEYKKSPCVVYIDDKAGLVASDGKEGYVTVDGQFISCEDYETDEEMDVELVGDFWYSEE